MTDHINKKQVKTFNQVKSNIENKSPLQLNRVSSLSSNFVNYDYDNYSNINLAYPKGGGG